MPQTLEAAPNVPVFTVYDRLRKAREHASLEQVDLAEAIGVSRSTVVNYENGRTSEDRLKQLYLKQWAMACGVDLGWLLTGEAAVEPDADPIEAMKDRRGTVDLRDSQSTCIAPVVTFPQVQSRPADTRVPAAA
jgi:transcriptional regulator with XRE-family HTH domain